MGYTEGAENATKMMKPTEQLYYKGLYETEEAGTALHNRGTKWSSIYKIAPVHVKLALVHDCLLHNKPIHAIQ